MSTQGTGKPVDLEFTAYGLNQEGPIAAAISIGTIYVFSWLLILAYRNNFWYDFIFPTKVNLATLKEQQERSKKELSLNKLVKLGTAPKKNVEFERGPSTNAAISVLTPEQILHRASIEQEKEREAMDRDGGNRRASRFFDMPLFKRQNEKKNDNQKLPPELPAAPAHIKRTHVFLSTPVLPPEPNDHMKSYNEEKHNDAWEEFYSEDHGLPYWVNEVTKESTWVEPPAAKFKKMSSEEADEESDWKQCWSNSFQRPYWYNVNTGENTWRDPFKYAKKTGKAEAEVEVARDE